MRVLLVLVLSLLAAQAAATYVFTYLYDDTGCSSGIVGAYFQVGVCAGDPDGGSFKVATPVQYEGIPALGGWYTPYALSYYFESTDCTGGSMLMAPAAPINTCSASNNQCCFPEETGVRAVMMPNTTLAFGGEWIDCTSGQCIYGTAPSAGYAAGSKKISQAITFSAAGIEASAYTGDVKTTYEAAYAVTIGIWDSTAKAMRSGCSVASSVTSRRAVTVAFEAIVTPALATAAQSAATTLTTDTSAMVTGINTARVDLGTTSTVVAMSASEMSAATSTMTLAPVPSPPAAGNGGGDSDDSTGIIVGVVVAVLVVGIAVGVAVWWFKFRPESDVASKPGVVTSEVAMHTESTEAAEADPEVALPDTAVGSGAACPSDAPAEQRSAEAQTAATAGGSA